MSTASGAPPQLQYLVLRASDAATEAGHPPGEQWLDAVLRPSAAGVSVEFREGRIRVRPGTPGGSPRLVAGFSTVEAASLDEAVATVKRRLDDDPAGEGGAECEIRETGCPGGLAGVAPLGPGSGLARFVILLKSVALEEGFVPGPDLLEPMARRNEEAVRAGVMLAGDGLLPSARGARVVRAGNGRLSVIDGPFAEAKELVAGYWLIQVPSIDDAVGWVETYPYPVRDNCDVEIRPVV